MVKTGSWLDEFFSESVVSAQMPIAMAAAPVTSTRILIDLMIVSSPSRGGQLPLWTPPVPQSALVLLLCRDNSFLSTPRVEAFKYGRQEFRNRAAECASAWDDTV